jgi:hypothetical protein
MARKRAHCCQLLLLATGERCLLQPTGSYLVLHQLSHMLYADETVSLHVIKKNGRQQGTREGRHNGTSHNSQNPKRSKPAQQLQFTTL